MTTCFPHSTLSGSVPARTRPFNICSKLCSSKTISFECARFTHNNYATIYANVHFGKSFTLARLVMRSILALIITSVETLELPLIKDYGPPPWTASFCSARFTPVRFLVMEHSNIELTCNCKEQIPDWEGTIWTAKLDKSSKVVCVSACLI